MLVLIELNYNIIFIIMQSWNIKFAVNKKYYI